MMKQRFQIHLSTALVLMFAVGGLMWANTRERIDVVKAAARVDPAEETSESLPGDPVYKRYGWPFQAASRLIGTVADSYDDGVGLVVAATNPPTIMSFTIECPLQIQHARMAMDAMIALAVLGAVVIVCEWLERGAESGPTPKNS